MCEVVPTIDCFAQNDKCRQRLCQSRVKGNFFDQRYDDIKMWEKEIAWANPPVDKCVIIDTVNKYEFRKMRGYIVVATGLKTNNHEDNIWIMSNQRFYSLIQQKSKYCLHVPLCVHRNDTVRNTWHCKVFYFDFQ